MDRDAPGKNSSSDGRAGLDRAGPSRAEPSRAEPGRVESGRAGLVGLGWAGTVCRSNMARPHRPSFLGMRYHAGRHVEGPCPGMAHARSCVFFLRVAADPIMPRSRHEHQHVTRLDVSSPASTVRVVRAVRRLTRGDSGQSRVGVQSRSRAARRQAGKQPLMESSSARGRGGRGATRHTRITVLLANRGGGAAPQIIAAMCLHQTADLYALATGS